MNELKTLKWNKEGRQEFMELIDLGCEVETRNGVHLIISPSGEEHRKLSDRMYQELTDRRVLEIITPEH